MEDDAPGAELPQSPEPKPSNGDTSSARAVALYGGVAAILAALIGFGGAWQGSNIASGQSHADAAQARRAAAYSTYLGEIARFTDLMYNSTSWMDGHPDLTAEQALESQNEYFARAREVSVSLEASYATAALSTDATSAEVMPRLIDLRLASTETFRYFRCATGIQSGKKDCTIQVIKSSMPGDGCSFDSAVVTQQSRTDLIAYLDRWSECSSVLENDLINRAIKHVN